MPCLQSSRPRNLRRTSHKRRLGLEPLEDRRVLATLTVTTAADDGPGSLRSIIAESNASAGINTICFSDDLAGEVISLSSGAIDITGAVIIDGDSVSGGITIDASASDLTPGFEDGAGSRVFNVDDGNAAVEIVVQMRNLTITGGDVTGDGGAILSSEDLQLFDSTVSGSSATGDGGGISSSGQLLIEDTTFVNNVAAGNGGGLSTAAPDQDVQLDDVTFSSNVAIGNGGGLFASLSGLQGTSSLVIDDSAFSNNESDTCLLYTSPSPRDKRQSRMPSSA